jgi:hypothetical protein
MYNSPDHQQPLPPPPPAPAPYYANPPPSYPPSAAIAQPQASTLTDKARMAGIGILASGGLILIAALSKAWFTAGGGSRGGGVGLLGLEKCRRGMCETATWFDLKNIPSQIPIFATVALIASLVAVAFLIHTGVMLLQNRVQAVKLKWLSQVLGLTSFGMVAFVFSLSVGDWSRGLSMGWSTFVGLGGLIGASVVTAVMVRPLTARSES